MDKLLIYNKRLVFHKNKWGSEIEILRINFPWIISWESRINIFQTGHDSNNQSDQIFSFRWNLITLTTLFLQLCRSHLDDQIRSEGGTLCKLNRSDALDFQRFFAHKKPLACQWRPKLDYSNRQQKMLLLAEIFSIFQIGSTHRTFLVNNQQNKQR